MKKVFSAISIASFIVLLGCAPSNLVTENSGNWKPSYTIQAGIAHGGIIENTDMKQLANADVDAFTGATNVSPTVGAHVKLPVYNNEVETGIDYMYASQNFTFKDNANGYNGKREMSTSQFIFPLTYNFNLLRKIKPGGVFSLKLGVVGEYNIVGVNNKSATLPTYTLNNFSGGMVFGINSMPLSFSNGSKIGFYADLYRGSRIYTDFYNQKGFEMPGSSFARLGIVFQFK
jgi:hypothetical protein